MAKKFFRSFGGTSKSTLAKGPNLLIRRTGTLIAGIALVLGLVACGGGGGGSTTTPPPTTVTATCPDDSKQTAATLDLATGACPGIDATKVTLTPANNATGVSPDTIATSGISVATSSALTTPALTDISLKAGTTSVPVTMTMVGAKGFKFAPSTKLLYAQAYNYVVSLTDTLGKKLSVSGSFTTASVQCVAPQVPNSAGTACVTPSPCTAPAVWTASLNACLKPVGSQAVGMNQLPTNALLIGDAGWTKAVTDGIPKFLDSGMLLTGYNTRPIAFAFYKATSGVSCAKPIYKDDGSAVDNNKSVIGGCNTVDVDWAVGTTAGVIRHFPSLGQCYEFSWKQTTQGFQDLQVTCPF